MKKTLAILWLLNASAVFADSNPYAVESAIYKVETHYRNGNQISFGTGVLIARNKILTNCHVVEKSAAWPLVVQRQTGQRFSVRQYYSLGKHDACVLVGGFAGTPVQFAAEIHEGENIWIYGYPKGLPVIGQGAVLGPTDSGESILLAAFCAPGSSGGPVLNAKGQLACLNYATYRYQNQCLCIPAMRLRPYLASG